MEKVISFFVIETEKLLIDNWIFASGDVEDKLISCYPASQVQKAAEIIMYLVYAIISMF